MSLMKRLLSLFVYIALLSFALFLINFKDNTAPYPLSFLPNIDKNYEKSFNLKALYTPLSILFIWCLHHSLFIREPIREIIKNTFNLGDKSQLTIYRIIAGILLLLSIFTYNSSSNPIGGGTIWDIQQLSSSNNNWFIRNCLFCIIMILLVYTLRELDRLEIVRSDIIITESVYGMVRHPVQLCLLLLLWITPRMTVSRFIWSLILTIYVIIGLYFEEQTLIKKFGTSYIEYKKSFPALMPHRKIHFECGNNSNKKKE